MEKESCGRWKEETPEGFESVVLLDPPLSGWIPLKRWLKERKEKGSRDQRPEIETDMFGKNTETLLPSIESIACHCGLR